MPREDQDLVAHAITVFFQAEDGIRDLRMSRGLGDVYKRQNICLLANKKDT
ncbi:hypothetical protein JMUB7533_26680 [Staphylococcus aureus]